MGVLELEFFWVFEAGFEKSGFEEVVVAEELWLRQLILYNIVVHKFVTRVLGLLRNDEKLDLCIIVDEALLGLLLFLEPFEDFFVGVLQDYVLGDEVIVLDPSETHTQFQEDVITPFLNDIRFRRQIKLSSHTPSW